MSHRRESAAVILLFALLLILVPHTLHGQSGVLYLPTLQDRNSREVGLALSNPTLENVTVRLILRAYDGSLLPDGPDGPVVIDLPPLGQKAVRTAEISNSGIRPGWAELQASSGSIGGIFMLFDGELKSMDGADLPRTPASRLIFPNVTTGPSSENEIVVINPTEQTHSQIALSLYDNDGRLAARKYFSLNPFAAFSGSIATLTPEVGVFEGYAVVETTSTPAAAALVGSETYRSASEIAVLNAIPESERWRSAYLPHVVTGKGYTSRLVLVNYGNQPQVVRMTLVGFDVDGRPQASSIVSVERSISAGARWVGDVADLFHFPGDTLVTGSIQYEVLTNTMGLTGYAEFASTNGGLLAAVPAQAKGYSDIRFSQVAEGSGYYTGLAILNPTTQQVEVSVDLTDASGRLVASNITSLAPGERRSQLARELLGIQDQLGGSLHLRTTHHIFAFEALGHTNVLAHISGLGNRVEPQESGRILNVNAGANVIASSELASINIAPGSLRTTTPVGIRILESRSLPPWLASGRLVGAVEITPDGLPVSVPALLSFTLETELNPGMRVPLTRYEAGTRQYQQTDLTAIVDKSGRKAYASIPRLMTLAAVAPPADSTPLSPPGGNRSTLIGSASYLSSLTPSVIALPAADTALTLTGRGFTRDAVVHFDGTEVVPRFVDSTSLIVSLSTPQLTVGAHRLAVYSPSNAKRSNPLELFVGNSVPVLSNATEQQGRVNIDGLGFVSASTVLVNGTPVATEYRSPTVVVATIGATATPPLITVANPTPGGGVSNAIVFAQPVVTPPPPAGKSYYVSPNGSDSGTGSLSSPWKTILKALISTGPGDTVFLRHGTYTENLEMRGDQGNRFKHAMGGSEAGWWTIQSYPGEVATLGDDFKAYSIEYSIFKNLNFGAGSKLFVGTADWLKPSGQRSHHIQITNNSFTGPQIRYGFVETAFDDSLIEQNTIVSTGGGQTTDHGIYLHNGNGNTLRGNVVTGVSGYGIHVYDERKRVDDAQTFFTNLIVENNVLSGSRLRSGLIVSQGGDTVVNGVIVRNNVIFNNADYGINLTNFGTKNMNNLRIYHNTLYDNTDGGIVIGKNSITNSEIKNNVISSSLSKVHINRTTAGPIGLVVRNNLYWPSPARLTNVDDSDSIVGDPQFVDPGAGNFHLQAGSAAINRGIALADVPRDKDGSPRTTPAPDLGAYEN